MKTAPEKEKPSLFNQLSAIYRQSDPDKTIDYSLKAVAAAEKAGNKKEKGYALSNLGFGWLVKGNYDKTSDVVVEAIAIGKELNDPKLLGACYNTLGLLNKNTGKISKSADNFILALQFREAAKDTNGMAATLNNLGENYREFRLYLKALESLQKAEKLYIIVGNKNGLGSVYANMGGVFLEEKKYGNAIFYFEKALRLRKETRNNRGLAIVLTNLSELYVRSKQYNKAMSYAKESIELSKKIADPELFITGQISLCQAFQGVKQLDSAEIAILPAIDSARSIGIRLKLYETERIYSDLLLEKGRPYEAFAHLRKAFELKDSIFSNQASEKIAYLQSEVDKQKRETEVRLIEEKDKVQKLVLLLSIVMLIITALFLLNRYRIKHRSSELLEGQKRIIEQKNKEIGDSINYARKIQRAMLPLVKDLTKAFPNGFGIYQPKDIVSGDFYWFLEHNDKFFIAVADCTGHGVPGAFMSMLGVDKLTSAVKDKNLIIPSEILCELNNGIRASLRQNETDSELRDGMDIALCCFDFSKSNEGAQLQYAGANRPLYHISNRILTELAPTKAAIGGLTENDFKYQNYSIGLKKGDTVFMFTDGYVDQFGGPKEKKFSSKRLKETLVAFNDLSMQDLEKELLKTLHDWMNYNGKRYEQIDDILVLGIRV